MARSKSYPYINLKNAVSVIDSATKTGKSWNLEQFASFGTRSTGNSTKSGAFIRRVSALKEYGLIQGAKHTLALTELGEKIVKPINSAERQDSIVEAFYKASQFSGVVEDLTFRPNESFGLHELSTLAVNKHGITRDAQKKFVKTLVDSAVFAEIFIPQEGDKFILNKPRVPFITESAKGGQIPPSADPEQDEDADDQEGNGMHQRPENKPKTYVEASVDEDSIKLTLKVPVSTDALELIQTAYKLAAGVKKKD